MNIVQGWCTTITTTLERNQYYFAQSDALVVSKFYTVMQFKLEKATCAHFVSSQNQERLFYVSYSK